MELKLPFLLDENPKLLIVDGAGTLFDPDSKIPIYALQSAFFDEGFELDLTTINKYMGVNKIEHIRLISKDPLVEKQALEKGRDFLNENDVNEIYVKFKKYIEIYSQKTEEIEGVKEALFSLKKYKIPVVMTTGYDVRTVEIIKEKLPWLNEVLTATFTSNDVKKGRPYPFMLFRAMELCTIINSSYAVKVGDTKVDMQEADNAQMPGIIVTSGILNSKEEAEKVNQELGRKHLILSDLRETISYIIEGTLKERILSLCNDN